MNYTIWTDLCNTGSNNEYMIKGSKRTLRTNELNLNGSLEMELQMNFCLQVFVLYYTTYLIIQNCSKQ